MEPSETAHEDLKSWMARRSGQLNLAAQKLDLDGLATKNDLATMRDSITAPGEEKKQLRQELVSHKKDVDNLPSMFDQSEALKLNRNSKYVSAGRDLGQRYVNNMSTTDRPQPT